ncbi:hypothetical protein Ddye_016532 [Dipteronia dyeriana]|uniref:Uncharacterized protein n=1 Tax=Dipteronia dyeriana TaxID=168575 RepID=A0AAD9U7N7_9ROSI|nr:hypothetical protein Ddye_016532 [Dipteronia dyeriana]
MPARANRYTIVPSREGGDEPNIITSTIILGDKDIQTSVKEYLVKETREDGVIPQVCVSLIERETRDVLAEDIPPRENTQQFQSFSGSNQLSTETSGVKGQPNMCGVPPVVADHGDIVGPQFDDVFGCQIEMNVGQYNHQYNEMCNDMNNEWNNEPNVMPIHEMDNEANFHLVDNVVNNENDKEPLQMESHARHVHRCSSGGSDIAGNFVARPTVTVANSNNTTTWVIPGAESYSFGMSGSRNLVEDEPTCMIYKG